jgi:hypothetical protein
MKDEQIVPEIVETDNVPSPDTAPTKAVRDILDAATMQAEQLDTVTKAASDILDAAAKRAEELDATTKAMSDLLDAALQPAQVDGATDHLPPTEELTRATAQLMYCRDRYAQRGEEEKAEQLTFLLNDIAGAPATWQEFLDSAEIIAGWRMHAELLDHLDAADELDGILLLVKKIARLAFTPAREALTSPKQYDPATWQTFDEVLQGWRLREWLSYELAGVSEAGGYRISPEWIAATIYEIQEMYANFRILQAGRTPGPDTDELTTQLQDGRRVYIHQRDEYHAGDVVCVLSPNGQPKIHTLIKSSLLPADGLIVGMVQAIQPPAAAGE